MYKNNILSIYIVNLLPIDMNIWELILTVLVFLYQTKQKTNTILPH